MQIIGTTLFPRALGNSLRKINDPLTVVGQIKQVNQTKSLLILQYDHESKETLIVNVPQSENISEFKNIKYIEVRGFVTQHGEIAMKSYTDFKQNFDLPTYNQMLRLATKQFRDLFNY